MGLALAQRGFGRMMPPPGVELDWSHPLARGLVLNFLGSRRRLFQPKNFCAPLTRDGVFFNASLVEYDDSLHFPAGAQNGCIGVTYTAALDSVSATGTLALRGALLATSQPNYTTLAARQMDASNAAAYALDISATGANNTIRGYIWNGVALNIVTGSNNLWRAGEVHTWVLHWDGSNVNVYQDGIAINSPTVQTVNARTGLSRQFWIAASQDNVSTLANFANLRFFGCWLYNRALLPAEIRWLCDEPYALYFQPVSRTWSIPAGATARSFAVMVG